MRTECPKCASKSAWFERDGFDIKLRCICGYNRIVATKRDKITVHVNKVEELRLPKRDTNLWNTLMSLASLVRGSSAKIAERLRDLGLDFTVSDVSSYLTILRSKKLVRVVESKRGIVGGSTWELTEDCLKLVGN